MKRRRSLLLWGAALFLMGVVGCSSNGGSGDGGFVAGGDLSALDTNDFSVADAEDAFASVEDATVESEMVMHQVLRDGRLLRHDSHPFGLGSHLGRILRELDITPVQMGQIHDFILQHRECLQEAFRGIWEVNQPIIEAANQERLRILEALRNGDITLEEARRQLWELSLRTRHAIRTNPANEPFLQAICECTRILFESIRSILNPAQQELWDQWVANLPGPCLGG